MGKTEKHELHYAGATEAQFDRLDMSASQRRKKHKQKRLLRKQSIREVSTLA